MSGTYCPKCPCEACERARRWIQDDGRAVTVPTIINTGIGEPECAIERIAREYAARGETLPLGFGYVCHCRKCSVYC